MTPWTLADVVVLIGLADPATVDYSCTLTTVELAPTAKSQTIPATMCSAESTSIVGISWELTLAGLQDWLDETSLQEFLWVNRLKPAFMKLTPAVVVPGTPPSVACQVRQLMPAAFGGQAPSPAAFTVKLPVIGDPTPTWAIVT